jgi:peroxiredoxin
VNLQNQYQDFQARNTEVIALAVHNLTDAQSVARVTGAAFPLLADPDHTVADAYGVYNLLGDGIATPSVFIINKSGQIVWSYIGKNINDRPDNQVLLENLPPA